jgi:tetratricopeptide (TPR) repeat protein
MQNEQAPQNQATETGVQAVSPSTARSRAIAIVSMVVVLVLPFAYLALHRTHSDTVGATEQQPSPAAAPDIAALEAAARSNPTPANQINLSLAYINANAPGRAIPVLNTVIASDPKSSIAWNNLCVAHTLLQEYIPALDACNHALQIDPAYQLAKNNMKWAQDEKQKMVQTLSTQEQTAPADRNSSFYLAEGLNFLHVGDNDQAIKAWQQALQHDPRNALAANDIGTAYMLKQQPATAVTWFQKAIELDPALQLAKNNLAWANGELNKPAK